MTIERNTIYKMDCLAGLREMVQAGYLVDCVITDPPYLINYKTNHRQDKNHKFCKTIENDNTPLYMFCGSDKVAFFKQEIEKHFTIKNIFRYLIF